MKCLLGREVVHIKLAVAFSHDQSFHEPDSPYGPLQDEHPPDAKLSNARGTLSMANTGRPNSGSHPRAA